MKKALKIFLVVYVIFELLVLLSAYTGIIRLPRPIVDIGMVLFIPIGLLLSALPMIIIAVIVYKIMERRRN